MADAVPGKERDVDVTDAPYRDGCGRRAVRGLDVFTADVAEEAVEARAAEDPDRGRCGQADFSVAAVSFLAAGLSGFVSAFVSFLPESDLSVDPPDLEPLLASVE